MVNGRVVRTGARPRVALEPEDVRGPRDAGEIELAHYPFLQAVSHAVAKEIEEAQRRRWRALLAVLGVLSTGAGAVAISAVDRELDRQLEIRFDRERDRLDERFDAREASSVRLPVLRLDLADLNANAERFRTETSFSDASARDVIAQVGEIARDLAEVAGLTGTESDFGPAAEVARMRRDLARITQTLSMAFFAASRLDYFADLYAAYPDALPILIDESSASGKESRALIYFSIATGVRLISHPDASVWAPEGRRRADYLEHREVLDRLAFRWPEFTVIWNMLFARAEGASPDVLRDVGRQAEALSDRDAQSFVRTLELIVQVSKEEGAYALATQRVRAAVAEGCDEGWLGPRVCAAAARSAILRTDGQAGPLVRTEETDLRVLTAAFSKEGSELSRFAAPDTAE